MSRSEMQLIRQAASILGRLGGSSKSSAKQAASRRNGMKGGRPHKERCLDCKHRNAEHCVGVGAWSGHPPCYGFERKVGVQGAKSPRLKPHDPQKTERSEALKDKKALDTQAPLM